MASELALDKERARLGIPLRISFKVRRYFSKPGDRSDVDAYIRALEEATRNFELTKEDYEAIGAIVEANRKARMKRRQKNFVEHGSKLRGLYKGTASRLSGLKTLYAQGAAAASAKNAKNRKDNNNHKVNAKKGK